jgi:hypothetical protein
VTSRAGALRVIAWLLTPIVVWAASFFGTTLTAVITAGFLMLAGWVLALVRWGRATRDLGKG